MDTIPIDPELQYKLERFAREHGQSPAAALQDAVTTYLEFQSDLFDQELSAVQEAVEELKTGRSISLDEFDQQMRQKHGIPR
jgi:predicted transcriptional regulator